MNGAISLFNFSYGFTLAWLTHYLGDWLIPAFTVVCIVVFLGLLTGFRRLFK